MRDRALGAWGFRLAVLALLGLVLGFSTLGAVAHTGTIVSSSAVAVGPYTMDLLFYAAPQVGQPIPITIAPRPVTADGRMLSSRPQLRATLQPSPGVPEGEHDLIFNRFFRSSMHRSDCTASTGLGLPIARKIAEMQGSRLAAEAAPGGRTVFTLALPLLGRCRVTRNA